MNKKLIQEQTIMDIEELPVHARLKPIRIFDDIYPKDEDELQAYWDFIRWTMTRKHAVLKSIPKQKKESDFWFRDIDEYGNDNSPFNTMDYQRLHPDKNNKYPYRLTIIFEKIKDLALLHSCTDSTEGRNNVLRRFKNLVEIEFRDPAKLLVATYKKYPHHTNIIKLRMNILNLNSWIRKCRSIWQQHAYSD